VSAHTYTADVAGDGTWSNAKTDEVPDPLPAWAVVRAEAGKYQLWLPDGSDTGTSRCTARLMPTGGGWSIATRADGPDYFQIETKRSGTFGDHGFDFTLETGVSASPTSAPKTAVKPRYARTKR
jgi:hypothetical protein